MSTLKIESLTSSNFSHYKTLHTFKRFGEITSIDEFRRVLWVGQGKHS